MVRLSFETGDAEDVTKKSERAHEVQREVNDGSWKT